MDQTIKDIKLLQRIEDIGLPENITDSLRWYGEIKTLKKLIHTDVVDLLKIYGIGEKKVEIIIETLGKMGLSLVDSRKSKTPPRTSITKTEFPYNLLAYISEQSPNFKCPEKVTQDIVDGIHFACLSLSDKKQAALYLRFECQQTLEKIAVRFSLSSTQIANIINGSIYDWFKTDDIKFIEFGMKGYVEHLVVKKTKSLIETSIAKEYNRGYNDGYEVGYNTAQGIIIDKKTVYNLSTPIEELDLSVRSTNCMKRAGIRTVADLVDRTEKEMISIRNLGRGAYVEIENKLHSMGLSFREEDESLGGRNIRTDFFDKIVKSVTYSECDGIFYTNSKTNVRICDDGKVFCSKCDFNHVEFKRCEYEITKDVWRKFLEDLLIVHNVINWSQEYFESCCSNQIILNDVSYSFEFVLDNETKKFRGGVSSRGVVLLLTLFYKYFDTPEDVQYHLVRLEDLG